MRPIQDERKRCLIEIRVESEFSGFTGFWTRLGE
jgi:hypothetical protein